jgi:2-polyprenyl-3-methyl-5-hydroxy-6-metoxy-1,4-benzoquinol methylase
MNNQSRHCPICHHQNYDLLYQPAKSPGPVVRCQNCGLIYVSTILSAKAIIQDGPVGVQPESDLAHSSEISDLEGCWEYDLLPDKLEEKPVIRINALDALSHIHAYRKPPGRILDFGCGWGFFLDVAQENGWEAFGLEPLPGHATYARANFNATIITDILREDTFPEKYFDIVTSFQVFEHLPTPCEDLKRLHKMMKQDGIVMIEVPNIDTWSVKLLGKRHRHFVQDHLNFFSKDTLAQMLEQNGFKVLETYYPKRQMSYQHLVNTWGKRILPNGIQSSLFSLVDRAGLSKKTLKMGIGDIVMVIGQKK